MCLNNGKDKMKVEYRYILKGIYLIYTRQGINFVP